tara:strand:+ start:103 stop:417 length:315 start_codon:yes stop_codon:yes gene_type:complete
MSGFLPERSLAAAITSPADPRKIGQMLSFPCFLQKNPALCKQRGFFYVWISAGTQLSCGHNKSSRSAQNRANVKLSLFSAKCPVFYIRLISLWPEFSLFPIHPS